MKINSNIERKEKRKKFQNRIFYNRIAYYERKIDRLT